VAISQLSIFTDRLTLQLINSADKNAIHDLHLRPEVDMYNTLGIPENIKETEEIIKPWIQDNERSNVQNYTFAIQTTRDKKLVGLIAIRQKGIKHKRAEVWFKIHPDYWGKGIASEALESILEYGFNKLKLHRIESGCAVENIGSIKVLEKVGMTREGRKRKVLPLKSGWSDNFMYAILKEDFES